MKKILILLVCFPYLSLAQGLDVKLESFTPSMVSQIQYGKSSTSTKALQIALNTFGYSVSDPGQETNVFDAKVRDVLKEFQIDNELPGTGVFDTATVKVANELIVFLNEDSSSASLYGGDPDLNKNYFEGGDSLISYIGNALDSYTNINITGTPKKDSSTLYIQKSTPNSNFIPPSTNTFKDTILSTLLGSASTFLYKSLVSSSVPKIKKIEDFYVNGRLDLVKCYSDPICSNI